MKNKEDLSILVDMEMRINKALNLIYTYENTDMNKNCVLEQIKQSLIGDNNGPS